MILISWSSKKQQLEQIFSVYWFADETRNCYVLFRRAARRPLSSDVALMASMTSLTAARLREGSWQHASLLEDTFEPGRERRSASAAGGCGRASFPLTCRSRQLWLPTANCRQRSGELWPRDRGWRADAVIVPVSKGPCGSILFAPLYLSRPGRT